MWGGMKGVRASVVSVALVGVFGFIELWRSRIAGCRSKAPAAGRGVGLIASAVVYDVWLLS